MSIIRLLDPQTANSIAAGEVVERPASVIKELVENALDAGATTVCVEITGGGILSMAVSDNGCGMDAADARLAFDRHATSKLRAITDLDSIGTLGFRGEALASIASVAKVTLRTRQADAANGFEVRIEGGQLMHDGPAGCPIGTTIRVEQLFYNTPARFKFLKKDSTEAAAIAEAMERLALARPDVSFRLLNNGQEVLHSPGNNDRLSAIYAIYGRKQASLCIPVSGSSGPVRVGGFVARPEGARNNRAGQTVLVNGRIIRAKSVTAAIDEAFKTRLMKGRFAFAVLSLDLPPELVDVNVHPQKLEVRFWREHDVFSAVHHAILAALHEHAGVPGAEGEASENSGQRPESPDDRQTTLDQGYNHATNVISDARTQQSDIRMSESIYAISQGASRPVTEAFQQPTGPLHHAPRYGYGLPLADAPDMPAAKSEPATGTVMDAISAGQISAEGEIQVADSDRAAEPERPFAMEPSARTPSGLLKAADLGQGRVIGQLFATYILIEWQDEMLLVDQHAAHEKIIYERLRAAWDRRQAPRVQPLLVPLTMTVTAAERILFEAEQDFFAGLGFTLEAFGGNGLIIRSLPDLERAHLDAERAVRSALAALQGRKSAEPETVDEALYQMACKAAVKAHDRLGPIEIERLLADLASLENPYTCPHGRPVIVRMPRLELEKRFKRVL